MKRFSLFCVVIFITFSLPLWAQEKTDSAAIARIKDEGMNRSQVMEILSYLTDVYGPRLTGSPEYNRAANWARTKLTSWGLQNAHLEAWGPFGRGWSLKRFSTHGIGSTTFPLIAYPKAWSPGTDSTVNGDVVYFDAKTDSAVKTYRGKLKEKFVLFDEQRELKAHFEPEARRLADSSLLKLANAEMPEPRQRRFELTPEQKTAALVNYHKWELCQKEGAIAVLSLSRGDGGNIFVGEATVPAHPDTPSARRISAYSPKAPKILPQAAVAAEHYNRMVRMLQKGERVKMEMNFEVNFTKEDSSHNVIAEIPGTDLKDEVVMIGAHFDSWHGGTGTTDNGTGSAVCMEAMRILKTLGLQPRRTIRIGLWGGEEQGLLGSQAYVKHHLGTKDTGQIITLKPEGEKFSVYFNHDNGTGRVRGVYMQGNEAARSIFRTWLEPFKEWGASTLSLSNTGGTDHLSFDAVGLPGFQFIQDEMEYGSRTHHSTMDVWDRAQAEDLKQASVIMAAFTYHAAMRDEKFPRKPQQPRTAAASSDQ